MFFKNSLLILVVLIQFFAPNCFANTADTPDCQLINKKNGKHFRIFNALLYKNLPKINEHCIEPINVMYTWEFFPREVKHKDFSLPREKNLQNAIKVIDEKNIITAIDIEHWPLKKTSARNVQKSIENYNYVIKRIKKVLPHINIGYYGVVPVIDFSRARLIYSRQQYTYGMWEKDNDQVKPIASIVDVSFPSLYTINSKRRDWINRAMAHIKEAKRLTKDGPVYPFIWPNYHEQGGKYHTGSELEADYWMLQLEFLLNNADGIVLWGGYKQEFSADMLWWQNTKKFIAENFNKVKKNNTNIRKTGVVLKILDEQHSKDKNIKIERKK